MLYHTDIFGSMKLLQIQRELGGRVVKQQQQTVSFGTALV
jgi:hypothetical protein